MPGETLQKPETPEKKSKAEKSLKKSAGSFYALGATGGGDETLNMVRVLDPHGKALMEKRVSLLGIQPRSNVQILEGKQKRQMVYESLLRQPRKHLEEEYKK